MVMPPESDGEQLMTLVVDDSSVGERLDAHLAKALDGLSRSRLKVLIKSEHVTVDGRTVADPSYRIAAGEAIHALIPEPEDADPEPENIPLTVVYEDRHIVVIDKQAGLVVHPGPGNWTGTLVNALLYHCGDSLSGIGGVKRPGIVHRIDKETSGLLVVAKTDAAHQALSEQFADHGRNGPLERAYTAFVWGVPDPLKATIATQIARSSHNRLKMAVAGSGGRHAVTHYKVVSPPGGIAGGLASQVTCRLETGRTHQIRVHMAHIGHPLIGDPEYGQGFKTKMNLLPEPARKALSMFNRQALHASLLVISHPESGDILRFESDLPADLQRLFKLLTEI